MHIARPACFTPPPPQAQRASVTPAEIERYEQYNERHGAKYVPLGQQDDAAMDEDGW
jgi:hypothetical protein